MGSRIVFSILLVMLFSFILSTCAEPNDPPDDSIGPDIPSIDDTSSISIVTWNIENFPQAGSATTSRVELVLDSLDADFYCLQEIKDKDALYGIVDRLDQYSVIISDETSFMHLAIVYKHDSFLPADTNHLYAYDDYNFAGRPPLWVSFKYEINGEEQVLNLIDVHMKCCERYASDLQRRHDGNVMLHSYLLDRIGESDSNFVVAGDWNDDIYDSDSSGVYAFEAFLDDPMNFFFITDSLASTKSSRNASYPGSYNSFIDNILISRSLFDEYLPSGVQTLLLDDVFWDYGEVLSDHRPVLWSFIPN